MPRQDNAAGELYTLRMLVGNTAVGHQIIWFQAQEHRVGPSAAGFRGQVLPIAYRLIPFQWRQEVESYSITLYDLHIQFCE